MAGWDVGATGENSNAFREHGCAQCHGTGFKGRLVIAELLLPSVGGLQREIIQRAEVSEIESIAIKNGMVPARGRAIEAIRAGLTSPAEARRVLGFT